MTIILDLTPEQAKELRLALTHRMYDLEDRGEPGRARNLFRLRAHVMDAIDHYVASWGSLPRGDAHDR